jgi:asparagine synthase (glutamine-hydrolysing)
MIELSAIASLDPRVTVPSLVSPGRAPGRPKYSAEWHCGHVSMLVESDRPAEFFAFDNHQISLIFKGDLLSASRKVSTRPAAHIATLYEREGDNFAAALRGTFAIILYDWAKRSLKAWTDHFGVQPLVFAESSGYLAIATRLSELLPLLGERPEINPAAVHEYLQYSCIPTPKTIYNGISKLAPGHQLTCAQKVYVRPYWDITYGEAGAKVRNEASWAADTLDAVRSAVSLNLTSIDDFQQAGCFLSGGTDSSSIAGLVGELAGEPPNTFTIGFDDPRYNEMDYARIASKRFNARHHEYFVTPKDILDLIQKAATVYDEPFGNSSIIPTYYCARLAAEHGITHLLAGDGGDELFGGNSRYAGDRVFQKYDLIPGRIREWLIEPVVSRISARAQPELLRRAASYVRRSRIKPPDRHFSYSLVSSVPAEDLFTGEFAGMLGSNDSLRTARDHWNVPDTQSELNRWLYMDLKIIITDNDLRKVTTMCNLAGVTPRYPMLDPALAEFTGSIPSELKVRGTDLRYIFKRAMGEVLPPEIIKKTKHGFGLPYSVWLAENKPLRDFTFDVLGSTQCRERGYFRGDLLEWLWSRYENVHRQFYGEMLWVFLMLELWHVTKRHRQSEISGADSIDLILN